MKTNKLTFRGGECAYFSPSVARFDVSVESGFAASVEIPDLEYEDDERSY